MAQKIPPPTSPRTAAMAAIMPSVEPTLLPDFLFWPDLSLLDCLSLSADGSLSPFGGTTAGAEDDAAAELCAVAGVLVLAAVV